MAAKADFARNGTPVDPKLTNGTTTFPAATALASTPAQMAAARPVWP